VSQPDNTGYRESPATTDAPVAEPQHDEDAGAPSDEDATTLTTDDEAQEDDSLMRPGNVAD
jgi:hypothetical protein